MCPGILPDRQEDSIFIGGSMFDCPFLDRLPWADYCIFYCCECLLNDCPVYKNSLCESSCSEILKVLLEAERCDYESN